MQYALSFPTGTVQYLLQSSFEELFSLASPDDTILITDTNVHSACPFIFETYRTIVIPAGEAHKNYATVQYIIDQLIQHEAHRKTTLAGVGGGVVTDVAGFVASIYMRGIPFGFVPTSLLGMVDAAIGGKNGIDVGLHKNMAGTIRQPLFILYDTSLLATLPDKEWSNGFAEVIKYACLFDSSLFATLGKHDIGFYRKDRTALDELVQQCADWKNKIVLEDEGETGKRKLLNFGHTAGHALETLCNLPHGHAVAIGMMIACKLSEQVCGLSTTIKEQLALLLEQYQLPSYMNFDTARVMEVLKMDKKRSRETIDYILLEDIGKPVIKAIPFHIIQDTLDSFIHAGDH